MMSAVGTFELRIRSNHLVGDLPQALSFLPLEVTTLLTSSALLL